MSVQTRANREIFVPCVRNNVSSFTVRRQNRERFHYTLKKEVEEIVDELFTKNNLLLHLCPLVYIPYSLSYHSMGFLQKFTYARESKMFTVFWLTL